MIESSMLFALYRRGTGLGPCFRSCYPLRVALCSNISRLGLIDRLVSRVKARGIRVQFEAHID